MDLKKMILAHLIEKIEVNRSYYITVRFYVALEDFQRTAPFEKIKVEEAAKTYISRAV